MVDADAATALSSITRRAGIMKSTGSCEFISGVLVNLMQGTLLPSSLRRFGRVNVVIRLPNDEELSFPTNEPYISPLSGELVTPVQYFPQRIDIVCDKVFVRGDEGIWRCTVVEPSPVSGYKHSVVLCEFGSGDFVVLDANESQFEKIEGSRDMTYSLGDIEGMLWTNNPAFA